MADYDLTHTPAKIIQSVLINGAVGIAPDTDGDWKTYVHNVPDQNDLILTVKGTQGTRDGRCLRTGEMTRHPGIQILVRAKDPEVAAAKAQAVSAHLTKQINREALTIETSNYIIQSVTATSDVIPLGQEEKNRRFVFSVNFIATIVEV